MAARPLLRSGIGMAVALTLCVTGAGCAAHATTTSAKTWQLRGVVESVSASDIVVRQYKTERVYQLFADERTVYEHDKVAAGATIVTVGTRVTVDVETQAGVHRALRFQVS